MLLHCEVVLSRQLRRDCNQQSTAFANLHERCLPRLQFSHAIGTPAAPEEVDDHRPQRKQIRRTNRLARQRIRQGECWGECAHRKHARLNPGIEQVVNRLVSDGEAFGLHECPRLRGDGIELRLKRIWHTNSLGDWSFASEETADIVWGWDESPRNGTMGPDENLT